MTIISRSTRIGLSLTCAVAAGLCGCVFSVERFKESGVHISEASLAQVRVGETTREWVVGAFGEPTSEFEGHTIADVNTYEWVAWMPFLVGIVLFGVWPNLIFNVTDDVVTNITTNVEAIVAGG